MVQEDIVKFVALERQYLSLREELLDAMDSVYRTGQMLDGACVDAFEHLLARRCNRLFAIVVGSGTVALDFAYRALVDLEFGGENQNILIPQISYIATKNSVLHSNNTPQYCDVDMTGIMDLESMTENLGEKNIGIVSYVNLFGNVVDWERFQVLSTFFNDLKVVEDAAQSFGGFYKNKPSGSLGDISVLSFDPMKNLPNYGGGGAVLTNDLATVEHIRQLRDNGRHSRHPITGSNSKMSEADCAGMIVKLKHFDRWQRRRQHIAEYYTQELEGRKMLKLVTGHPDTTPSWHKFVVLTPRRDQFRAHLLDQGIQTKVHYDYLLSNNYANAETARVFSDCGVSLPIYPELTDLEVERIVNAVKTYDPF